MANPCSASEHFALPRPAATRQRSILLSLDVPDSLNSADCDTGCRGRPLRPHTAPLSASDYRRFAFSARTVAVQIAPNAAVSDNDPLPSNAADKLSPAARENIAVLNQFQDREESKVSGVQAFIESVSRFFGS